MRDPGEDDEADDDDIEVERMPDLDGWEFFRAVESGEDRWLVGLRYAFEKRIVEFGFWTDAKKDPVETGELDARASKKASWSKAIRDVAKEKADAIDDEARAEIIIEVLERSDPTYADYEERLVFSIEPADTSADEDEDSDDDGDGDEEDENHA